MAKATIWAAAIGVGLSVWGVVLVDADHGSHTGGTTLVAVGTAIVGGAVVGGLLSLAQVRIDDRRADREAKRARNTGLDLTLETQRDLQHIDLSGLDLSGRHLAGRDFQHGVFGSTNLASANLYMANLAHADMTGADLTGANLVDADLSDADLTGADLKAANLTGAKTVACVFDDTTKWPEGLTELQLGWLAMGPGGRPPGVPSS